jgi:hypothetical protein
MASEDDDGSVKIVLTLIPGRDDLAIGFLEGVKPKYRADRVRTLLYMHLSGQQLVQARDVRPVPTGASTALAEGGPAKPSGAVEVSAEVKASPAGAKAAEPDDFDLTQLDGLDMQTDFSGMTGGAT